MEPICEYCTSREKTYQGYTLLSLYYSFIVSSTSTGRLSTLSSIFGCNQSDSSPGLWAATAASYCPSRPGELPKLIATEYRTQGAEPPCICGELITVHTGYSAIGYRAKSVIMPIFCPIFWSHLLMC